VCSCLREHTFGGVGPVRGDPHQRTLRDRQALFAEPVADDVVDVRGLGVSELLFERQAYGAREPVGVVGRKDVRVHPADLPQRAGLGRRIEDVELVAAEQREAPGTREPIPELLDGDWVTVAVSLRLIR
jgi:hypothetical protein